MSVKDKLDYLNDTKQAIKTAIQGKGQAVSDNDTFRSYADKINAIETSPSLIDKTITENGTYNAIDDNADGYSSVIVSTPVPWQTLTISSNGTYDVSDYKTAKVEVGVKHFANIKIYHAGGSGSTYGNAYYRLNGGEWIKIQNVGTVIDLYSVEKLEVYADGAEVGQQVYIANTRSARIATIDIYNGYGWSSSNPYDVTPLLKEGYTVGIYSDD